MTSIAPLGAVPSLPVAALSSDDLAVPINGTNAGAPGAFSEMVTQGLAEVDGKLKSSESSLQRLAAGETQNLHDVMVRLEEARLSLQLLMQVRSRLLESYQDVMKMQI